MHLFYIILYAPVTVSLLIAVNILVVTLFVISVLVSEFLITPSTLFLDRGVRAADCCCVFVATFARGFRAEIAGDVAVVLDVMCGVVWIERSVMVVSVRSCVYVCMYAYVLVHT
jgi:hypothetical protein